LNSIQQGNVCQLLLELQKVFFFSSIFILFYFFFDFSKLNLIILFSKGNIELFCKGADNIILERAAQMEQEQLDTLNTAISDFSKQGLRTLLIAHLPLTEEEYEAFNKKYHEAEISMEDREERMDAVSNNIEQNLTIIGATAVEDKLQEDVAETIEYLRRVKFFYLFIFKLISK